MNRATAIWGPDAKEFKPERWLDNESGLTARAKEIQGYHHLLTFIDGPRTCLGKGFALTEFKVSRRFDGRSGSKGELADDFADRLSYPCS
jgi:cytochrome P450